jgi:MoaA/NifB/PqqE/SkfB family radical SAM enzyme
MGKILIWQIDRACNLRCKGCNAYEGHDFFNANEKMYDWLHELKRNKIKYVSITGGEPTLHPDISNILRWLKNYGFKTHIATNGTTPKIMNELIPYLDAVTVSLDSHVPELHNEYRGGKIFDTVIKNIKNLRGKVPILTANALITPFNYNNIDELAHFSNNELGVPLSICYPDNDSYVFKSNGVTNSEIFTAYNILVHDYNKHKYGNILQHYKEARTYTINKHKNELSDFITNNDSKSICKAGKDIYFANLNTDVYPCFYKTDELLNKNKYAKWRKYDASKCNQCFMQCFREPSSTNIVQKSKLIYGIYSYTRKKQITLNAL